MQEKAGMVMHNDQTARTYASVLYELTQDQTVSDGHIKELKKIVSSSPVFLKTLSHPYVSRREKEKIIERIVPSTLQNYVKVLVFRGKIMRLPDIFEALDDLIMEKSRIVRAVLYCVTAPDEKQKEGICGFVKKKYNSEDVQLSIVKKEELLGGFVLRVGTDEYDWSLAGRLSRMEQQLMRR